ncbi:MAG TPA: VWA domain-containing protein [Planctomycetota bacterium]|nr:VWA domain-containing protein [Planctomycetota bacterium]
MTTHLRRSVLGAALAVVLVACSSADQGGQGAARRPAPPPGTAPALRELTVNGPMPRPSAPQAKAEWKDGGLALVGRIDAEDPHGSIRMPSEPPSTEQYAHIDENPFLRVASNPLSTFSIDVDTASYALVRRFLGEGRLPPVGAVRIEELVNYFPYDYAPPEDAESPFAVHLASAPCPWTPRHRLVRVALKGRVFDEGERPPCNFVFLVDVSGSMQPPDKLPLLKQCLRLLGERLRPQDRVAIAVYAGSSGLALPSTPGTEKASVLGALDRLEAGGSTNGGSGIRLAYRVAEENFVRGGVNRVILATDGDFNVGTTSNDELVRLVEEKAKSGVFLSVLGFGTGNYKDDRLEALADRGNGNYAYIDSLSEGRKVLVEQAGGTLQTIAKDVKIQVEFNPARVAGYRLLGYENRLLRAQDFDDDRKDAGEIGAGHTVTAFYEVVPAGQPVPAPKDPELKYQSPTESAAAGGAESLTVKLRWKAPDGDTSRLGEFPFVDAGGSLADADQEFRFGAAVACFGMVLRGSAHAGGATQDLVLELGTEAVGADPLGWRREFLALAAKARAMGPRTTADAGR